MASNINPNNIDGTYPVAGQDNDSQGFRTNFTNTKNNFIYTKSEIEDLQSKVVVKAALTGTSADNNMAGTIFRSAEVKDLRETRIALGTVSGTVTLDHTAAHYYTVTVSTGIDLAFAGFPAGKVGRIRLEVDAQAGETMTFPAAVTYGLRGLRGYDGVDTVTFGKTGIYIFEFVSENGATDIHVSDLSRNRTESATIINAPPAGIGESGDVAGMIKYDATNRYMYICVADYNGTNVIWHKSTGPFTVLT